ncbi:MULTISPECIES: c-type cytochrome [Paraburkholderia]|uniref:c-type cytochrome n=1 Tax=Paraburkholderia TaxID=1822464 RepID=UPI002259AA72|nr:MULTISPECIES: c-type cytochrome [Paraburkholderia]MCX4143018.1 c-type cytochrome [Paraburkholderia aspalathi]MDN7175692.1 c-type cytochrome [Paraburkholderia sp. SEWSISQ10-3 4]MDQ6505333.1 c-type cytochrome [Paraburkholderia aspalathi]
MTRGVAFAVAMLMAGALAGAFTSSARAADAPRGQIVANSNACMGCHAVDRKLVGPSFQQIATKYKGDAQAPAKLSRKVKDGGSGVWGMIPMPAHQSMSDADIRTVVDWVLAGAPSK